ncbi:autotransporter assembly complex protein TamA [Cellvibrio polysaccharolyticus]|uniref:autotransporter assembly complex protein TamA n=1 Tax=Cellvibrio polysaccharolyticus TaxID=2082724 RepID=UPI001F25E596|nr:autotransporter assembly complex family protein [Cellvibrio polysaccharolyticus]
MLNVIPVFGARLLQCILGVSLFGALAVQAAPTPRITIEGGNKTLQDNVRHFLPFADESCQVQPWRLRSLMRDAQTQIHKAGEALGYYQLQFDTEISRDDECWGVTLRLTPGEPVRVRELRIVITGEASEDRAFQAIHNDPGMKVGDRLNHGRYETLKSRFGNLAIARGYFDGKFDLARISINRATNAARVELVYDSGSRYRFGNVEIQQDILDDDFVRRYVNLQEGEPYDTEQLLELKNLYSSSNYFAAVMTSPDLNALGDKTVPVKVQLEARKRYSYSAGAGVATDTGPRLLLGYEDRYFNRRGHNITANLHLATVQSSFEAAYTIPMHRPAYEYVRLRAGYHREDTSSILSDLYRVGASYTVFHDNEWLQTWGLDYAMEESQVGSQPMNRTHLLIPSLQFSRTRTDGRAYPLRGWRLATGVLGSPESLGSDVSFLQWFGRGKYIRSALGGRIILRADLGVTEVNNFPDLPASLRFFAGGDASVRGYSYKSIGERDEVIPKPGEEPPAAPPGEEGEPGKPPEKKYEVIGGRNLLVTSIEYDYLIRPQWAIAAFYDQGDASNDFKFNFRRSVGLGVRWISPIGPVRFDIACALDDVRCGSSGLDGWGFHFSIGPDL